ncbi:Uncharacterized protein dnm_027570 [Desulfonema magnum]|uniref:Uncharacterized protein n=1 Tax=Desulfonema magnum TaxID=45655 RepID=A0A975BKD6_9BACT|nr:Uncharacterized protein dnm_027570 [Desulfonema magnum]
MRFLSCKTGIVLFCRTFFRRFAEDNKLKKFLLSYLLDNQFF